MKKGQRTDPGGRLRLQFGQFCLIHDSRRRQQSLGQLVGRSRQKIKFAGGVCQILVNKPHYIPFSGRVEIVTLKNVCVGRIFHQTRATRRCGELHNAEAGLYVIGDVYCSQQSSS